MRNVGTRISLNNLNLKIHFRFELVSMVNCISNNGCRVKHHNVKSSLDNFILTMCVVLMRKNLSPVRDFIRVYMCVYTAVLLFFVFCFCVIKKTFTIIKINVFISIQYCSSQHRLRLALTLVNIRLQAQRILLHNEQAKILSIKTHVIILQIYP